MKRGVWSTHLADVAVVNERIADPDIDAVFLFFSVKGFKCFMGVARVLMPFRQSVDNVSASQTCQVGRGVRLCSADSWRVC